MKINLKDIEEDKCNFNYMSIEEYDTLKNSIKLRGIQDKITLRLNPLNKHQYIIVKGHWRIKALKDLGYTGIPNEKISEEQIVIYPNMSETVALEQLFDSNIRGNIDPLKYIDFLLHYMKIHNINQTQLSQRLGIRKSRLSKILSIMKSDESVGLMKRIRYWRESLKRQDSLTFKHLAQLARLNDDPVTQLGIYEDYMFSQGVSANELKRVIDERMANAKKIDQELIYIGDEELAERLRDRYESMKYDKNSYKILVREINKRTGDGKMWYYYFPPDKFTEEEVKQFAIEHGAEYCGKETTITSYKVYVGLTIKEIDEGKSEPQFPRREYHKDFDKSFHNEYTWCFNCYKLIKEEQPLKPYNYCSIKCLRAKSRKLKR